LQKSRVGVGVKDMERVQDGSLDIRQFVLELTEHPRIDKMYIRFLGMRLPHPLVNRPHEGIGPSVL
jgi:hypothetical protein